MTISRGAFSLTVARPVERSPKLAAEMALLRSALNRIDVLVPARNRIAPGAPPAKGGATEKAAHRAAASALPSLMTEGLSKDEAIQAAVSKARDVEPTSQHNVDRLKKRLSEQADSLIRTSSDDATDEPDNARSATVEALRAIYS